MRLFVAVNFPEDIKDGLYEASELLKRECVKGSFSRRENYHLTLCFIGETERVSDVKRIMDGVSFDAFNITIYGLGSFRSGDGDIYWAGVKENAALSCLAAKLSSSLSGAGFKIDKKPFRPHITLGRRVKPKAGFDRGEFIKSFAPARVRVSKISLMKSERIDGILTYTEIYSVSGRGKKAL
ncbi:MAG: RNA 2',3'-cyclic phosphodiesterase [Clostridia bacterium]|nr:RNA 2',3'-cyclic phosphodiesterase [Clostridia bacterium]